MRRPFSRARSAASLMLSLLPGLGLALALLFALGWRETPGARAAAPLAAPAEQPAVTATAASVADMPLHYITLTVSGGAAQPARQPQSAGIKYDNLVTNTGIYYALNPFTYVSPTYFTRLLADDIVLSGTVDGLQVSQIKLAVYNNNSSSVLVITRLRFWYNDGSGGGPGTYFLNASGEPVGYTVLKLYAPGLTIVTVPVIDTRFTFPPGRTAFFAGLEFDNAGLPGTTQAQLDQLGQSLYNPPAVGSSADVAFETTTGGSYFKTDNPAGSGFNFGGAGHPAANFGWQFAFAGCPTQVTTSADSGPGSLRNALDCAKPGDTVTFTLAANSVINLSSELPVRKPLTIDGSTLTNVSVSGNNAGRVFSMTAPVTLISLTIENGNVTGSGGGLYTTSDVTLTNVAVLSNTASFGDGGGAWVGGAATLSGGLFQNNVAFAFPGSGGGLFAGGSLELTGTQLVSNKAAGNGGGARLNNGARLNGGLFQNNTGSVGGGLYADSLLNLTDTQFLSNTARAYAGGGAFANGSTTLNGGLFQNNQCMGGGCRGGGLEANDDFALTGTQFLRNTAFKGGGVDQTSGGVFASRVVNGLFARNVATDTLGAAIYLGANTAVQILHTTIAGPTVGAGSAIYVAAASVGISNTIVASHTTGIKQAGGTVYEDYNLLFGNTISRTGIIGGGANDVFGDPVFANPGGDDYHLGIGSAAIDAGVDVGVATDFEGDHRPIGPAPDIGYDEARLRLFLPLIQR